MRYRLLGMALVLAASVLGACRQAPRTSIPISGQAIRPDLTVDVEVVNWNGSVAVLADPRYRTPEVVAQVRRLGKGAPKTSELRSKVNVEAISGIENGRRLIRVRGEPREGTLDTQVAMDLEVRVARVQDVRVSNAGGMVNVSGFAGALTIVNGAEGRAGGRVLARTQNGITSPISITTTTGDVIYKSGPGTSGAFELLATGGSAQFESRLGTVTQARPDPSGSRYRAVLDGGANSILVRTDKGSARVEIIENAGTSGPDLWDGWPSVDDGPRWMQGLAGNLPEQQNPPVKK